MGMRGPKPVDLSNLNSEAQIWANLLFNLRDGVDGSARKVKWQRKEKLSGGWVRHGQTIEAAILKKEMSDDALRNFQLNKEGWQYVPPVTPAPRVWEQLKNARSDADVRAVARGLQKWNSKMRRGYQVINGHKQAWRYPISDRCIRVLREHAKEIRLAKKIWAYPKKNDDKKIEFFCKILAGLTLGIAPTTAIHRLTGWRWPKEH